MLNLAQGRLDQARFFFENLTLREEEEAWQSGCARQYRSQPPLKNKRLPLWGGLFALQGVRGEWGKQGEGRSVQTAGWQATRWLTRCLHRR